MTTPTTPVRRILTVCLGNHCRSPIAALVLDQRGGPTVQTRSAGLSNRWVGQPAHRDMIVAAAQCGYDLSGHRGVQVDAELMAWADVILAMDNSVLQALQALADEPAAVKLALYLSEGDVPDPWGQPYESFTACVALVQSAACRHV
jgi:protein-tyrosine phosphatase